MTRLFLVGLAAGLLSLVELRTTLAQPNQPDVLPREFECMVAHTKFGGRFVVAKNKCVGKCLTRFWKGAAAESDCMPPSYGGATLQCIDDDLTLKGVENKYQLQLEKVCVSGSGADCPECYASGCESPHPEDTVTQYEDQFDSFVPGLFCERTGAVRYEQRCQLYAARTVTKLFYSAHRCYTKCFVDTRSGGDVTTCLPPATDPDTIACLVKVKLKSAVYIDRYCDDTRYPDASPECSGPYPSGEEWANLVGAWVDGLIAPTFCASPSVAFID